MSSQTERHKKNWVRDLALTGIGWELALPIVGGAFLGYQLDRLFNLQYVLTLSLLVLGILIGYYSLYKYIELEMLRTKVSKLNKQKGENAK